MNSFVSCCLNLRIHTQDGTCETMRGHYFEGGERRPCLRQVRRRRHSNEAADRYLPWNMHRLQPETEDRLWLLLLWCSHGQLRDCCSNLVRALMPQRRLYLPLHLCIPLFHLLTFTQHLLPPLPSLPPLFRVTLLPNGTHKRDRSPTELDHSTGSLYSPSAVSSTIHTAPTSPARQSGSHAYRIRATGIFARGKRCCCFLPFGPGPPSLSRKKANLTQSGPSVCVYEHYLSFSSSSEQRSQCAPHQFTGYNLIYSKKIENQLKVVKLWYEQGLITVQQLNRATGKESAQRLCVYGIYSRTA